MRLLRHWSRLFRSITTAGCARKTSVVSRCMGIASSQYSSHLDAQEKTMKRIVSSLVPTLLAACYLNVVEAQRRQFKFHGGDEQ